MKSLLTLISAFIIFLTSAVLARVDVVKKAEKMNYAHVPEVLLMWQTAKTKSPKKISQLKVNKELVPMAPMTYGDPQLDCPTDLLDRKKELKTQVQNAPFLMGDPGEMD